MKSLHHTLKALSTIPKKQSYPKGHLQLQDSEIERQRGRSYSVLLVIKQVNLFCCLILCSGRIMHISCKSVYFVMVSLHVSVLPFTECTAFEEVNHKSTNNKVYKVVLYHFLWCFPMQFLHVHLLLFFLNAPQSLLFKQYANITTDLYYLSFLFFLCKKLNS